MDALRQGPSNTGLDQRQRAARSYRWEERNRGVGEEKAERRWEGRGREIS